LVNIIFMVLSILWVVTNYWWVLQEETFLKGKYGDACREYIKRTPRYVGIPRSMKGDDQK